MGGIRRWHILKKETKGKVKHQWSCYTCITLGLYGIGLLFGLWFWEIILNLHINVSINSLPVRVLHGSCRKKKGSAAMEQWWKVYMWEKRRMLLSWWSIQFFMRKVILNENLRLEDDNAFMHLGFLCKSRALNNSIALWELRLRGSILPPAFDQSMENDTHANTEVHKKFWRKLLGSGKNCITPRAT